LKATEYLTSGDGRTRTIEVETGQSLRVAMVEDYPGHGSRGLWTFPIESFHIADATSDKAVALTLSGGEALLAFEKMGPTLYVLQVKQAIIVPPASK
jgi:hypothetical protein